MKSAKDRSASAVLEPAKEPFTVESEGAEVFGAGAKNRWISVRNLTGSSGVDPRHALAEVNCFTTDGNFRLEVPDGKFGDYVQVLESRPCEGVEDKIIQLRAGLDEEDARKLYSERQSYRMIPEEDGLRLEPTRACMTFGPVFSKAWFKDASTSEIFSAELGEDGMLPEDFRLPGGAKSRYYVQMTAGQVDEPPSFGDSRPMGVGEPDGEEFDHKKMKTHRGDLYVDGAHFSDPVQGQIGNCWFVASASAIAGACPEKLEEIITPLDDGRYQVNFKRFDHEEGKYVPDPVTVSPKFFRQMWSPYYGKSSNSTSKRKMELWFPILEKGYAQLRGDWPETASGSGTDAFERLLGAPATWLSHRVADDRFLFSSLLDAIDGGQPIYASVPEDFKDVSKAYKPVYRKLVKNHAYTMLDAYERDGQRYVKLRNPWGKSGVGGSRGVFELDFESYQATFNSTTIGNFPKED